MKSKTISKYLICVISSLLAFVLFGLPVGAASELPTQSYTHIESSSGSKRSVPMRSVYSVKNTIDIRDIGVAEGIEKISDIDCDEDGNIYILTSDSKLFSVNANGELLKRYDIKDETGETVDFSGASGVLAERDEIYIADTANKRVLEISNSECVVTNTITKPDDGLIPEDFVFAPIKIEKDSKGVLYVLCDGAYYGALLFEKDGDFSGFYGANSVKGSPLTTLAYIWDSLTKNDIKRSKSVKKLPYQFVDMYVDSKDFIYTCTGKTTKSNSTGQIKKLSPSGTNILYKQKLNGTKVDSGSFNFGESLEIKRNNTAVSQNFVSIQSDERGYIYALDSTFGIIYVYDTDCNLITAFGGGKNSGKRDGVFSSAISMAYSLGNLIVADNELNTLTVFERTEFGETLLSAQQKTLSADYISSESEWLSVLSEDSGNHLALKGLAKAYCAKGDYEKALQYSEEGIDYVTYGQALEKIQANNTAQNFILVFGAIVICSAAIAAFAIITVKKQVVLIKNEKIRILLRAPLHPFESFNAVRYKNKGSLLIAAILCVGYYISAIIAETASNFRFTSFDSSTSNALYQFLQTIGLVALFSVSNWAVCVLMEGKGNLKFVFTVTSYSILPLIIYNILFTVLSHLITSPTNAFLSGLSLFATIIAGIVLTVGLMVIHEFSFPKYLGSIALTLFAMILIIFIIFMMGMLLSQFWTFIVTVFLEIVYR